MVRMKLVGGQGVIELMPVVIVGNYDYHTDATESLDPN